MPSLSYSAIWRSSIYCLVVVVLLTFSIATVAQANGERHRKRSQNGKNYGRNGDCVAPVTNQAYRDQCGGCHFVYQPGLLPARSWQKIMHGLKDHFGEDVSISLEDNKAIIGYLAANAADSASSKVSRKIMKSLSGQTPIRVSQVPYIIHKHEDDDIPADAFKRKSVGSLGNCIACHTRAEQGDYDDDYVRIPE